MKHSSITLAVVTALGAFAGTALAQSSAPASSTVTLFGIVDTGVRAVRNGDSGTVKSLTNDGLASSRIGFRGEEDLGGGLKAGFWLEGAFAPDSGGQGSAATTPSNGASVAAKFFNRRSTVSLLGAFGEVRLGRDFTPSYINISSFDAYGFIGVGGTTNLVGGNTGVGVLGSGAGTLQRADNSVGYFLPATLGGLYGSVMAAAGEGNLTNNGHNRYVGGRVGYAAGPIDVAGAYGRTRIPGNDDFRVWNVGASYNFTVAKLSAYYHRAEYQPSGLANRTQKLWSVSATVPLGQGELRATYKRSDIGGGTAVGLRNEDDARLYAVGYIHNLSKRTALYADVGRLQNRGGSLLSIPGGTSVNFTGGQNSTALALGVRHTF